MGFQNPIVTVIQPASLLTIGALDPGHAVNFKQNVTVTPDANALAIEIAVEFRWIYIVTGNQSGTVYARQATPTTPPVLTTPQYTVVDVNPAIDQTYNIEFCWVGTGNSLASPYYVSERINEYKTAVSGGTDYQNSPPVPMRESCPTLIHGGFSASAINATGIIIPAVGSGFGQTQGIQYYPRIWSLSMVSVQSSTGGVMRITDDATGAGYFNIDGSSSVTITPMGLVIPTLSAIRATILFAVGSCFVDVLYDYAPVF